MAFYKNPEEMFKARAEQAKKRGDAHWAKAKNGEGDHHYASAKKAYNDAKEQEEKAKKAKGKTWK